MYELIMPFSVVQYNSNNNIIIQVSEKDMLWKKW